jgi:hypothetical protein
MSLKQHCAIKFCAKLGKCGSVTLQLLRTAYGNAVLSSAQVLRWHKAFKDGKESIEDKQLAGCPSTSKTENIVAHGKAVLDRDQHVSVRLMAGKVRLPKTDDHRIITKDLHMTKIAHTWYLHHDNAPSHTSFAVREFLVEHNITMLPHPPHSPDSCKRRGSCDEGFEQHLK